MADRKHITNLGLSSSNHLKPSASSTSLSAKTSSTQSQLFQPHPMLSSAMMPSLESYLEAYQSLLGGGSVGRDPTMALSALACNYSMRTAGGMPMSMPFVPPSYFTFPSMPMDMTPYGLMSPVLLPPFFANLYCDQSSSGAAAMAAALGGGTLATGDYRDAMATQFNSTLWQPTSKDDVKTRPVESKDNSGKSITILPQQQIVSQAKKEPTQTTVMLHSTNRSVQAKAPIRSHHQQQNHCPSSSVKAIHPPPPPVSGGNDSGGSKTPRTTASLGNSDKGIKSRQGQAMMSSYALLASDQDAVPIDFSASAPNRQLSRETVNVKANKSTAAESACAVPSRTSVVVSPPSDRQMAGRATSGTVHHSTFDVKSSTASE